MINPSWNKILLDAFFLSIPNYFSQSAFAYPVDSYSFFLIFFFRENCFPTPSYTKFKLVKKNFKNGNISFMEYIWTLAWLKRSRLGAKKSNNFVRNPIRNTLKKSAKIWINVDSGLRPRPFLIVLTLLQFYRMLSMHKGCACAYSICKY